MFTPPPRSSWGEEGELVTQMDESTTKGITNQEMTKQGCHTPLKDWPCLLRLGASRGWAQVCQMSRHLRIYSSWECWRRCWCGVAGHQVPHQRSSPERLRSGPCRRVASAQGSSWHLAPGLRKPLSGLRWVSRHSLGMQPHGQTFPAHGSVVNNINNLYNDNFHEGVSLSLRWQGYLKSSPSKKLI